MPSTIASAASTDRAALLTRTGAAVTIRSLRNVRQQLGRAGIDVFETPIVKRAAYRDIFDYGGMLAALGAEGSNFGKAKDNARAFAGEVLAKLREAANTARVA